MSVLFLVNLLTCHSSENIADELDPINLKKVQHLVDSLDQDPVLKNGYWAFSIKSTKTGETILEHNPHKTLNVASSMKVLTTLAGLKLLGSDFRFSTYLEYDGRIENGVLKGNLYVRGGGDPTLGSKIMGKNFNADLATWVGQVKAKGITKIEGDIIADESLYNENTVPYGWIWGDIGNYYGAPVGAINLFDNIYKVVYQPGDSVGAATKIVKTVPYVPNIEFINDVVTAKAGTGDQSIIYGAPYQNQHYTNGTVPQGGRFSVKGAIPDPAFLCISHFRESLKKSGIEISGQNFTSRQLRKEGKTMAQGRTVIYAQPSPSLLEMSKFINLYSMNLFAEAIVKKLGLQEPTMRNTMGGAKVIKDFWEREGIEVEGLHIYDGSGLSHYNGITANQLTQMLFWAAQQADIFDQFYSTLPISGKSGTMSGIGNGTRAQGNLRAKTGSMTRVISYTGYFTGLNGELLCFALMANQYTTSYKEMKAKLSKLMIEMVEK